jgi:chaperonin GroEL (HSP60 family)
MTYAEDLVNKVEKAEAKIAESSSCGDTCSTCAVAPVANQEENDKVIAAKLRKVILDSIVSNVFEEKEFKELFYNVFERMAHNLSLTLGPFGSYAMIDQGTNFCMTKDGFHVLQNIQFADQKQNRIRSTLYTISHQMVTKVGDGSTTAVVAAFSFLKQMMAYTIENKSIRPKELNEKIQNVVEEVCKFIAKNAIPVNKNNLLDVVHNIANIASNDNKKYTDMITSIYEKLGMSCNINLTESSTFDDSVSYEDGVYSTPAYLIDTIYHNKSNVCDRKNCGVIMFDHTMDNEFFDIFTHTFNECCLRDRKPLIVIGPFYDQFLMDTIRKDAESCVRKSAGFNEVLFPMVFLKSNLTQPVARDMYMDLASLFGATIYRPDDTKEWLSKYNKYKTEYSRAKTDYEKALREEMKKKELDPNYKIDTEAIKAKFVIPEEPKELIETIKSHIGYCNEAELGDKVSSFKGFDHKNESIFNALYHDAEVKLQEEEARALANDTIDNKVFDARTRFSKINCKSATIKVGGSNRLEMSMNLDTLDDAVKASASAVKYGYNQGCNLAIIKAIDMYCDANYKTITDVDKYILNALKTSFIEVYRIILNKGFTEEKTESIIDKSLVSYQCYNMFSDKMDTEAKVINSCRTDIEILKGAIAMVGVVLTCNQYISSTLNK